MFSPNFSRALGEIIVLNLFCFAVDVALGLTVQGTVKVWTLDSSTDPIYENESKNIRCLNAISMICCFEYQRTVIVVCSKYWQVGGIFQIRNLFYVSCTQKFRNLL